MKKSAPIVIILIAILFVLLPSLVYLEKKPHFERFPFVVMGAVLIATLYRICNFIFHETNNLAVKNRCGDVRLLWKILILLVTSVLISSLIREVVIVFIPGEVKNELIQFSLLRHKGHNIYGWGRTIGGCIEAVSDIFVVWFMVVKLEGRTFSLKELGLDWRKSSLWYIGFGILLGSLFPAPLLRPFLDYIQAGSHAVTVIQAVLLAIPLAFGEEILFRAYFQNRVIERIGVPLGVMATAVLFRLVHFPNISSISVVLFELCQFAFWCLVGYLYYRNRSLYFVGSMHSTANIIIFLAKLH
jgi:membrane protease YdiL (CAAX protease family)